MCTVYDVGTGAVVRELTAHDSYLSCCRFVDGDRLLTSSGDASCILWSLERGGPITHFHDHTSDVMSVAVHPLNPSVFVSASADATAKVWHVRSGKATATFVGHESDVTGATWHRTLPEGTFATSCDDAACRLFDVRSTERPISVLHSPSVVCGATSLDFSEVGTRGAALAG